MPIVLVYYICWGWFVQIQIGQVFNHWTVIDILPRKNNTYMVLAKCSCGTVKAQQYYQLKSDVSKSCGCQKINYMTSHGMSRTQIYSIWRGMVERCSDTKHKSNRKNYFNKGIRVCDEWHYFENFYKDMGDKPFHNAQIDRIDNNGDYCKENCRWVTPEFNNRNKTSTIFIKHDIQTKSLST